MKIKFIKRGYFTLFLIFIIALFIDKNISYILNSLRFGALNNLFIFLDKISVWIITIIFVSLLLFLRNRKLVPKYLLSSLITVIVKVVLKYIVARTRPYLVLEGITNLVDKNSYSFPSGHTIVYFASLPFLIKEYPKSKNLWILIGVLIGISRIYLGVHYFSDVIVSVLIGLFIGNMFVNKKR